MHNAAGGIREGSAYLQNLDITFEIDLERLFGIPNDVLFAYFLWNDDSTFSDRYSGDAQVVSNIDTDEAFRLYEFWYEHAFSDSLSLRLGLYDLNSEFDAIDTAGLFLNSSHGIGADYAQTGQNGPSIFPSTSLTARLAWHFTERSSLRYALLDAVPGDPDDSSATSIEFNSGEGALHAVEFNHTTAAGSRFGIGGFAYTASFDSIADVDATGAPVRRDGNNGIYGFLDMPVFDNPETGKSATAFFRYGMAEETLNPLDSYMGAGIVFNGLASSRPDDQFGIAIASARAGSEFRLATGSASHETTIELTYSAQVNDWLRIQPDLQIVINPGIDRVHDDAYVVGIRFELVRGFSFD
jgi:porin